MDDSPPTDEDPQAGKSPGAPLEVIVLGGLLLSGMGGGLLCLTFLLMKEPSKDLAPAVFTFMIFTVPGLFATLGAVTVFQSHAFKSLHPFRPAMAITMGLYFGVVLVAGVLSLGRPLAGDASILLVVIVGYLSVVPLALGVWGLIKARKATADAPPTVPVLWPTLVFLLAAAFWTYFGDGLVATYRESETYPPDAAPSRAVEPRIDPGDLEKPERE